MIEAVNSVLSNAPYTKAAVEQQSVSQAYAANPDKVQQAPQAPFISPYVHMDVNFDKAVLLLRDAQTGDVVRQIPTESQLEAYKRAQTAALKAKSSTPKTPDHVEVEQHHTQTVAVTTTPAPQIHQAAPAPQAQVQAPLPEFKPSEASFAPQAGTIVSVDTSA